ncbi:MAG: hypothetical protein MR874_03485 [Coriobacteriaceae bacterium]|nr:hypothetical protein [Coriobacteriaceae bacterium]
MTLDELCSVLRAAGLPYAQIQWDASDASAPPPLPYALLVPGTSADVMADGTNFQRVTPYTAEVYTRGRDMVLEGRIETALQAVPTQFVRRSVPLGGGVLETTYTVTVLGS